MEENRPVDAVCISISCVQFAGLSEASPAQNILCNGTTVQRTVCTRYKYSAVRVYLYSTGVRIADADRDLVKDR